MIGIIKWLLSIEKRRYTYRIIFVPETIGSIFYIKENLISLKELVVSGYVLTCLGDEGCYSYLYSRNGDSLTDRISLKLLRDLDCEFKLYPFTENGSDERQFCFPGVDLPIGSLMKSKYGEFPQYHSSLDNLDFVTPKGLKQGFDIIYTALQMIETNRIYKITTLCEPQLGKSGLYPQISDLGTESSVRDQMNVIAYLDGQNDLLKVSEICSLKYFVTLSIVNELKEKGLIKEVSLISDK
jgi:aminopeptidase-like protein